MAPHPIVIPVFFSGGGVEMHTTSQHLAPDGAFVRCLVPLKEGSEVELEFSLPADRLRLRGIVVEAVNRGVRGFRVRFDRNDHIEAYLLGRPAPPAEKRSCPRAPTRLDVGWSSASEFIRCWSENLSKGG